MDIKYKILFKRLIRIKITTFIKKIKPGDNLKKNLEKFLLYFSK